MLVYWAGFQQQAGGPNYIAIAVAVICIIALMLPSSDVVPSNSSLWSIFHLSSHQKMVFAYSLGIDFLYTSYNYNILFLLYLNRFGDYGHLAGLMKEKHFSFNISKIRVKNLCLLAIFSRKTKRLNKLAVNSTSIQYHNWRLIQLFSLGKIHCYHQYHTVCLRAAG